MSVVPNAWHFRGKLSMAGRVTLSLLIVFCCLRPEHAVPQDYSAVRNGSHAQPWVKPAGFVSTPQENGSFARGTPLSDGSGGGYVTPTTPRQPMQYATARTAEPGVGYANGPGFVTTRVGDDQDEIEFTPLERLIQRSLHRMSFRLEYLNWSLSRPRDNALGGATLLTGSPAVPFAFPGTPGGGPNPLNIGRVSTLSDVSLENNNGLRGTFEIPFDAVVLEFGGFVLDQASDTASAFDLPQPGTGLFVATTFTVNGAASAVTPRLYDESFNTQFSSSLWGAGGNIIFNTDSTPGEGLRIRPVLGFQYIGIKERLTQTGVFNAGRTIADQRSLIAAQTNNRIYGPNLGVRVELEHRWFTFGVSPNVLFAANSLEAAVASDHFLGPNDPLRTSAFDQTIFTAGFQMGVYGRLHVTENVSIHIGWDFLWLSQVLHPERAIRYDANGVGGVPVSSNISAERNLNDYRVQGLSVGGEIRF